MNVRQLLDQIKNLPEETLVCVAEVDEAFAANAAGVEPVESAKIQSRVRRE
ncbi:hypothetical protein ACVDG5_035945 [Mesorhizobium sp. ORM6]